MKNAKWRMGLLMVSLLAAGLSVPSAHGATATVDGVTWKYKVAGNKATVTGASPAKGAMTIPSQLGGYPVRSIGEVAFAGCDDLTAVEIPTSVRDIDPGAFNSCSGLKSVKIPSSVMNISYGAFDLCTGLTSVTLSEGLKYIGAAFEGCTGLTSVKLPASLTDIGLPFMGCSGLKSISVAAGNPAYASKDGILFTKNGKMLSICPCGRKGTYSVPSGVTDIRYDAFLRCSGLTSVTLPSSVTNVGYEAFASSGLKTLYVPASWKGTSMLDVACVPSGCKVVYVSLALAADSRTFTADAANSKELEVTANVAWTVTSSVSWLALRREWGTGNGTVVYDVAANTGAASRTGKITVTGGGLTRTFTVTQGGVAAALALGASERTFTAAAASSKELEVTANVSWTVTSGASWLALRTAGGNGNGTIVYDVAANTGMATRTGILTVAGGGLTRTFTVTQRGKGGEVEWSYTVDGGTATVTGADPAEGNLVIPSTLGGYPVTGIGESAFMWRSGLMSVTLPNTVTNVEWNAFYGCNGLKTVAVASDHPAYASKDGVLFTKDGKTLLLCPPGKTGPYSIPAGVRGIGYYAFLDCEGLTSVEIPGSVTNIEDSAFFECLGLTSVTIPASVTGIGDYVFYLCTGLRSVTLPDSVKNIGHAAFHRCDALTTLTIPNSVTNIGGYAFEGCSSLTTLTIPGSVRSIGPGVFYECSVLKTLYVPASWKGTSMLADAAVPAGCKVVYVSLTLGADSRTFTADAASGKLLEVTANVAWTAKSSASWLTVKTASGSGSGTIVYDVAANTGAARTGMITVAGGGLTRTFTVTQSGKTVTLTLGASERTFTAAAANGKLLEVTANVPWTAKSSVSWLTVRTASGSGNGNIEYAVAANTGTDSRTGTITVSGGGLTRAFTVTQSGKMVTLTLGATERTFTADAASGKLLEVTANVSWTAKSSASWLTVKTASGSGNGNIEYAVAANTGTDSRAGTITVSGGGLTRAFTVTQSGKTVTLTLGATERTFTADAASGKLLEVTANVSWTAKSSASWLTVKTASGSGNGNIEYAVASNTGAARTGTITVAGGGLTRTFTVTQQGVKTETQESPVGIPYAWLEENAAAILASNGGDYEAAAMAKAANGKAVWECYVAGLSTTDKGAEFKVKSISFVDGEPAVEWEPDLNEGGTSNARTYTVQGKPALTDNWGPCDASSRFFRVQVELP